MKEGTKGKTDQLDHSRKILARFGVDAAHLCQRSMAVAVVLQHSSRVVPETLGHFESVLHRCHIVRSVANVQKGRCSLA